MTTTRIRELRKEMRLSQEELAEAIGVTRSAVSSWELGTRVPPVQCAVRLSEFFGVSVDYLCGKTNKRNFINTLITEEIDISKLNYNGITALTEYYKFLLSQEKYTEYKIAQKTQK